MREISVDGQIGLNGNIDLLDLELLKRHVRITKNHDQAVNVFQIVSGKYEAADAVYTNSVICCIGLDDDTIVNIAKALETKEQIPVANYLQFENIVPILNFIDISSCINFIEGMYQLANGPLAYDFDPQDIFNLFGTRNNPGRKIVVKEFEKCILEELSGTILYFWFAENESMLDVSQTLDDLESKISDKDAEIIVVGSGTGRINFKMLMHLV